MLYFYSFVQVNRYYLLGETVTTTKITTLKIKKNIEKSSKHQNIKSVFLVHHNYEIDKDQNIEIDKDHYHKSS
jgi:hypothetical protein